MKGIVLSVQSGVSSKTQKPYKFVLIQLENGDLIRVYDGTGRDFPVKSNVELVIQTSFDMSPRVLIK